jgi:choline dehydrogenase-like flavoprotein
MNPVDIKKENTFDAIVVGSGMSGGVAAKELCERGLKVLLLERGYELKHPNYNDTPMLHPWEFEHRNQKTVDIQKEYPIQSLNYAFSEATKDMYVKDTEHPYIQEDGKPFRWIRGYHTGGRSLMWGRQVYRWSDLDFEANARDGVAVDWPIRYRDIAPWYSYVEKYVGISGSKENMPQLPDSDFLPPMDMTILEQHIAEQLKSKYTDRRMIIGRAAHATIPMYGRGPCQSRNLCPRGCPYGGYFSSVSVTIPMAAATGNLTIRHHSVVESVVYDEQKQRASGVRVIDALTKEEVFYYAPIIFLNASTLGTAQILLNSTSARFPNGMGNGSGELGHNLMDHHHEVYAWGNTDKFQDSYHFGRRPNGIYIPRFRNLDGGTSAGFLRGFGYQGWSGRDGFGRGNGQEGFGADFKESLTHPGKWSITLAGFGETLPHHDNRVKLDYSKPDQWGIPQLSIKMVWRENETKMREDMRKSGQEMLEAAGMKDVGSNNNEAFPGFGIHEMGTARMGRDPKTSVLNANNQLWEVPNVFVTDGAMMTSAACVNPSLTYMALTARAVDFAIKALNRRDI